MTQIRLKLTFDDEEKTTLQRAIDHYLQICRQEIKKGESDPFEAHKTFLTRYPGMQKGIHKRPQNLTWGEDEVSAVKAALTSYLVTCEREIARGTTDPFAADSDIVIRICTKFEEAFLLTFRALVRDQARREVDK
jgi:hypothetical protein